MSEFVQIIRFKTDADVEKLREMNEKYRESTAGRSTYDSSIFGRDLDTGDYVLVVNFPSKEAADENDALPETQASAEAMGALATAPPSFSNVEVLERG